jgi:hypothetical protein
MKNTSAVPPQNPLLFGDSKNFPAPNILVALARNRASGVFHLEPSGLRFYLRDGSLEAVEGVSPLGEVLLQMGAVSKQDLASLETPGPIGQGLLGEGKISLKQLLQALEKQIRLGVARLLAQSNQTYVFFPHGPLAAPSASLSVEPLLVQAALEQEQVLNN